MAGKRRNVLHKRQQVPRKGADAPPKVAEFRTIPLSELHPAGYNPRVDLKPGDPEYEKIKDSITGLCFAGALVVNKDMTIIGGHQRYKVCRDLGMEELPCMVVDLDKTREKALNVALNKVTGSWDFDKVTEILQDLDEAGFDTKYTGFDEAEKNRLFASLDGPEDDGFDVGEALLEPRVTLPGDVWMLGRHRVICADSTLAGTYEAIMEGRKANLVLTDPPYNVDVEEQAGKIANDDMGDGEFYEFLLAAFRHMHSWLADDGSIYVFHADMEGIPVRRAYRDAGFYQSQICVWVKHHFVLGHDPYNWRHEPVIFGWKAKGKHAWFSDRSQTTIWEYPKPWKNEGHPTAKPVPLMAIPIRNSTMTNGLVLDPFLGGGSTLIACCETGRVCRGAEIDPRYVDVAVRRYIAWCGGSTDNVSVLRGGRTLTFQEALEEAGDGE